MFIIENLLKKVPTIYNEQDDRKFISEFIEKDVNHVGKMVKCNDGVGNDFANERFRKNGQN